MSTSTAIIIAAAAAVVVVVVFSLRKRGRKRLERVQDPYVQGLKALVDGDREGAFAMLQRSVKSGNAPVDAYLRLGRMLRESGEVGKALQIHKSLTVKSDMTREEKVQLFVDVAEDYSKLGRSKQAVHVLETAVRGMGLKEAEVFRILAKEYHLLGNVEQAYQCLKDLKRQDAVGDRELALYLCSAGEQKAEAGELKEARKILHRALKHDSDSPAARVALGNIEDFRRDRARVPGRAGGAPVGRARHPGAGVILSQTGTGRRRGGFLGRVQVEPSGVGWDHVVAYLAVRDPR
jgi:lipopolysaccharide biosynthesis regulator YciM